MMNAIETGYDVVHSPKREAQPSNDVALKNIRIAMLTAVHVMHTGNMGIDQNARRDSTTLAILKGNDALRFAGGVPDEPASSQKRFLCDFWLEVARKAAARELRFDGIGSNDSVIEYITNQYDMPLLRREVESGTPIEDLMA